MNYKWRKNVIKRFVVWLPLWLYTGPHVMYGWKENVDFYHIGVENETSNFVARVYIHIIHKMEPDLRIILPLNLF